MGAKFWLSVLTKLQNRGVKVILIACVDGLKGFTDAINTVYPEDIRKAIYTTNAIESLNSVIRKATIKRKLFPADNSAKKVVYLEIQQASIKWIMSIRNWKAALNRFMIEFEKRLTDYI